MMKHADRKRGFTLIEVALALVVVGVGVMALFSLISTGMDMSARAVADTHAAMFADSVFNGFRSQADEYVQVAVLEALQTGSSHGQTNTHMAAAQAWADYWKDLANPSPVNPVEVAVPGAWDPTIAPIKIGTTEQITFVNRPQHGTVTAKGIENYILTYKLAVKPDPGAARFPPPDWNTRTAMLWVWPSRYGAGGSTTNALMFYSEFPFPGSL